MGDFAKKKKKLPTHFVKKKLKPTLEQKKNYLSFAQNCGYRALFRCTKKFNCDFAIKIN